MLNFGRIFNFTLAVVLLAAGSARALSTTPEQVCAGFPEPLRKSNCLEVFKRIPNQEGLSYTLRFLQLNSPNLKDASCVQNLFETTNEGIRNKCQFVFNDMTDPFEGDTLRAHGYFVDLCASKPEELVQTFYVNKGTGTERFNYADIEGEHSTNLGAYLTTTEIRPFIPFRVSGGYRDIKEDLGGMIPALNLIGLHSTNNHTASGKPMHASPYHSSWGCPSIAPESVGIMQKLAENGPSLVMNYGPSLFHPEESLSKCDAVPDMMIAVQINAGGGRSHTHFRRLRGPRHERHTVRLKNGRTRMTFSIHGRKRH